mgnify:CR=1 FL=1
MQWSAIIRNDRVESITLLASTPSFVQRANWEHGLQKPVLEQFMSNLEENQNTTIRRFIALQFMGESGTAKLQKQLRAEVAEQQPDTAILNLGLAWLLNCDYRDRVGQLPPQHWIFGGLDRLIPVSVGSQIEALVPTAKISYFDECAHAPFLTQTETITETLLEFIQQLKSK